MSSSDFSDNEEDHTTGPSFEVVYPVGEETEVPQTKGQLFKTVLVEGNGAKPPRNSKVTVSYKGTLADTGATFDSSDSFEFAIGAGQVIKGWDQGVATMRKGERAILKCLPDYAYGAAGSPPTIPPNATLNFEVEVKDWTKSTDISENKDKSIMKNVEVEGRNWDTPDYESQVKVDVVVLTGSDDDANAAEVWRRHDWEVTIGETRLPGGLEKALCSMKEGEEATVVVDGRYVMADEEYGISTPHTKISYKIRVHSLHKVKTWTYKGREKLAEGVKRKDAGNEFFKKGDWVNAEKKYRRCLEFVELDHDFHDEEDKKNAATIKVAALNNLAQVLINLRRYSDAVAECNKVLTTDAGNLKALFRRGKVLGLLDEWDDALKDLRRIVEVDPANVDAQREIEVVVAKQKAHDKAQKAKFGNMFAKLAAMEEKEHKQQ